jgi:DMSO/TMAO reductase YedYZ molybdopterin-dependent catalytic subunit/thiosulfate reductase cytochrome b subunit
MKRLEPKHPRAVRWFHWINAPLLAGMVWSGLLIYWANDVYSITLFGHKYFMFFPEWIYKLLHIPFRLAEGMAFHFLFMWLFFVNGILYVAYTAFSGEWRALLPNRHTFKEAWQVLLHDLHLRKTLPPQGKFNAAQRIAYTGIVVMGMGSVLTGLAIYKPVQLYWLCWLCGGYHAARIIHFILTLAYCLFFVVHVVQVILAGWNNFRAMVAGFEVIPKDAGIVAAPGPDPVSQTETPAISMPAAAESAVPEQVDPQPTPTPEGFTVPVPALRRRTFLSFGIYSGLGLLGFGAWKWLYDSPIEAATATRGARAPLRRVLNANERFFRGIFSNGHPVQTYPISEAVHPNRVRFTGHYGLTTPVDAQWRLQVTRLSGELLSISLDELQQLPKTNLTYMFKCVEGWDQISNWAGVRFSDFIDHYGLQAETEKGFVGFVTPDKSYYVGIDMPSAMHPQTLLAYEMKGRLLTVEHGAPLRLIIPVKYGIKNLKRIGTIGFSDERPRDYWAEQGYDYYAGL